MILHSDCFAPCFAHMIFGIIGNIGICAWSASTAVLLALCTGERKDRASLAWKVVGQIKERVVLPEVRNWHGKGSCCGKLTQCCQKASWQCFERRRWLPLAATSLQETDAMLSESQLAMLRKEALVAIGCNISSPRFIDVAFLGCACCAEGHVGRHTQ